MKYKEIKSALLVTEGTKIIEPDDGWEGFKQPRPIGVTTLTNHPLMEKAI
jgi:hypothetical protein